MGASQEKSLEVDLLKSNYKYPVINLHCNKSIKIAWAIKEVEKFGV